MAMMKRVCEHRGRGGGHRSGSTWLLVAVTLAGCTATRDPAAPEAGQRLETETPPAQAMAPPRTTTAPAIQQSGWTSLFDGQTLAGWRVLADGAFTGHAKVYVDEGTIVLERGSLQTGIGWQGDFPRDAYEVSLEAMRVTGYDFFCGMTFPVGDSPCTLIVGGWGGTVVGLSNVDGMNASENQTTTGMTFENQQWYRIRLRVSNARIEAWIDDEQVINLARENHRFSVWWEQEPARPFGIATWDTGAALRTIRVRHLDDESPG